MISSVLGEVMNRINAQYLYRFATILHPLGDLKPGDKWIEIYYKLKQAEDELLFFLTNTLIPPEVSFQSGRKLLEAIQTITQHMDEDKESTRELTFYESFNIASSLREFETVFGAEFSGKDIFSVSKKGIYSTYDLVENAERFLSEEQRDRIPDAMPDLKQAGRCIAFELPTAGAFHIFRAIETVSKRYVTVFRGTPPVGRNEITLGGHIRILRTTDADERVVDVLDQIRRLHRNPVMHPEQSLTMNEVLSLFGIAQSAIGSMVADMETKATTPSPAIVETLPDSSLLDPEIEEDEIQDTSISPEASTASSS